MRLTARTATITFIEVAGVALVGTGLWLISVPLALIAVGLFFFTLAVLWDLREE